MAVNAQDLSRKNFRWGLPQRSLERSAPRSDPTELKSTIKKKLLRYSSVSVFVDKSNQNSWRKHLRNKVFRTTLLVVLTHVIFWFPYNLYALMKYINEDIYEQMSEHANIFKDLQILITLVNPFLYGF
ncbi:hypothetical protein AB6A40_003281 [Gnathostoma spinigerum]|uniref:G-protein coupled receptors family 1 profile domain-containing protein n=1 Tax=Gnathostoma spinigerum TaxID=75299 RepID=A0ABD6EBF1_9BILA